MIPASQFERVKTYSELQRAVYYHEAWLVEKLLKEGGARSAPPPH